MHARSALFDLYGDHLLSRDGWAPVASTVDLLGDLGISAPAVRTAISRVTREGWLAPRDVGGVRGHELTAAGRQRMVEAGARIYAGEREWDGQWHVVVLPAPRGRTERARIARSLSYLGYGLLAPQTWIAPRPSPDLTATLGRNGIDPEAVSFLSAQLDGPARDLAARVWDLTALDAGYRSFLADLPEPVSPETPAQGFVARSELVHRWRLFLFSDPDLPAPALPVDWPGPVSYTHLTLPTNREV